MKIRPNFSWQKYEGSPENYKEQFQFQLQNQYTTIANSINSTINDISYFLEERQTGENFVNGQHIWNVTFPTGALPSNATPLSIPIPINVVNTITFINFYCCVSNGTATSSNSFMLPILSTTTPANEVAIKRTGMNIVITSGGTDYSAYSGFITILYTKT